MRARRALLRGALVAFQAALSLLLLVTAGVTRQTASAAQAADARFDPADAVAVTVDI